MLHEVKEYLLGSATDNTEALNMLVSNFETLISAYGIEEEDLNDHLEDHKMMKLSRENKLVRSKRHIEIIQYDRVLIQHECHMWLKNFITMAMLPKQLLLDVFDLRSVERSKIASRISRVSRLGLSDSASIFQYSESRSRTRNRSSKA